RLDLILAPEWQLFDASVPASCHHRSMDDDAPTAEGQLNRRALLRAGGLTALLPALPPAPSHAAVVGSAQVSTHLIINGAHLHFPHDARTTLLDLLRDQAGLTGTKKGCDHGQCGACTVHIDGRRVLACLTLAATLDGAQVETIEGLELGGR